MASYGRLEVRIHSCVIFPIDECESSFHTMTTFPSEYSPLYSLRYYSPTHILTNEPTDYMKRRSSKPNNSLTVNKLYVFCGIRNFITAFTRTPHLPLSWARSIKTKSPQSSYQRICTSLTFCDAIRNRLSFHGEVRLAHYTNPSCRTSPCRQSATFYSVYSLLSCISGCCLLQPQPEEACR